LLPLQGFAVKQRGGDFAWVPGVERQLPQVVEHGSWAAFVDLLVQYAEGIAVVNPFIHYIGRREVPGSLVFGIALTCRIPHLPVARRSAMDMTSCFGIGRILAESVRKLTTKLGWA
jgi:hypothetical protein